jgi:hypothetical protein
LPHDFKYLGQAALDYDWLVMIDVPAGDGKTVVLQKVFFGLTKGKEPGRVRIVLE